VWAAPSPPPASLPTLTQGLHPKHGPDGLSAVNLDALQEQDRESMCGSSCVVLCWQQAQATDRAAAFTNGIAWQLACAA